MMHPCRNPRCDLAAAPQRATGPRPLYCSKNCGARHYSARHYVRVADRWNQPPPLRPVACGNVRCSNKVLPKKRGGQVQAYCSMRCGKANRNRTAYARSKDRSWVDQAVTELQAGRARSAALMAEFRTAVEALFVEVAA